MSEQRRVSVEEGQTLAAQWKCPFFETSAKFKINSIECFHEAVRVARSVENSPTETKDGKQRQRRRSFLCALI